MIETQTISDISPLENIIGCWMHLENVTNSTMWNTQRYLAFILVLSVEQVNIYPGSVHRCNI